MNLRKRNDLIVSTLNLIGNKEKRIDWLVRQMNSCSQSHVAFKQKKEFMTLLANHLAKLKPLPMVTLAPPLKNKIKQK